MTPFTSDRERRLWLWTLLVVVAIYSTLALTSTLAEWVVDDSVFIQAFIIGFFLIYVAILFQGFRAKLRGVEIGALLGIAAVYLMVFARTGIAERTHLFEYSVLALFIHEALKERADNGGNVSRPALIALVATAPIGALDECIQALLPNRIFDIVDIGFNALAAFMGVLASVVIAWVKGRITKRFRKQPLP